jgi:hypothetical protein
MTTKPEPKVRCVPMGTDGAKILAIEWADGQKTLRYYYPDYYGAYYYDEITWDGEKFIARSGRAYDVKLRHENAKWEQVYLPTTQSSAFEKFMKAFQDPWWSDFNEAWSSVTSLCPAKIE